MVFSVDGDVLELEDVFGDDVGEWCGEIIIHDVQEPITTIDGLVNTLRAYDIDMPYEWMSHAEEFLERDGAQIDFTI